MLGRIFTCATLTVLLILPVRMAQAQAIGLETLNTLMPASGGMGGVSIAAPQDLQSAVHLNPATLAQFRGTQFSFSGTWIEPTYNLSVDPPGFPLLFGVLPFPEAKSDAQGVLAGNIALTHDLREQGLPATMGIGLTSGAGAGVDFRQVPQSNGTHANIVALDIIMGAGMELTERLHAGATIMLSNTTLDGPFVGITGSASDYGLRGTVGLDYALNCDTLIGAYYKTKVNYTFENLAGFGPPFVPVITYMDVAADRPAIAGLGVSNTSLLDGRLLLAMDATYQQYTNTDLFGAFYEDQWSLQFGAQYDYNEFTKLRLGYVWAENPLRNIVANSGGGVTPPGGSQHLQYVQALFANIPLHRISAGIQIRDFLPGVDLDLMGGGMFEASQRLGLTTATLKSYWVGAGMTWRFGCRDVR